MDYYKKKMSKWVCCFSKIKSYTIKISVHPTGPMIHPLKFILICFFFPEKSCGHPGDTPNGDFELVDGDDFVFGAIVQYTCKTG